jgi:hypothetical protein
MGAFFVLTYVPAKLPQEVPNECRYTLATVGSILKKTAGD